MGGDSNNQFLPIHYVFNMQPINYDRLAMARFILNNKANDEIRYADAVFEESSSLDIAEDMLDNIGIKV